MVFDPTDRRKVIPEIDRPDVMEPWTLVLES